MKMLDTVEKILEALAKILGIRLTKNRMIVIAMFVLVVVFVAVCYTRGNSVSVTMSTGGGTAIGVQNTTTIYNYPTNRIQQSMLRQLEDRRSSRFLRAELDQGCIERIDRAERMFMQGHMDEWLYELSSAKDGVLEAVSYVEEFRCAWAECSKEKLGSFARMEADNALGMRDYDSVVRIADRYQGLLRDSNIGTLEAYRDMASVLSAHSIFAEPDKEKISRMKDAGSVFDYLNCLAGAGMLDWNRSFDNVLKPGEELGYQPRRYLKSYDDDGNPIYSHEFVRQYQGRMKHSYVEVQGVDHDPHRCIRVTDPRALEAESFSDKTLADLMPYIASGADSRMTYDESRVRVVQLCSTDAQGHETVECMSMQTVVVPEPISGILVLLGIAGLTLRRRRV